MKFVNIFHGIAVSLWFSMAILFAFKGNLGLMLAYIVLGVFASALWAIRVAIARKQEEDKSNK